MDESAEFQQTVFEFLADPATHNGCEVRRIDTHAAAVFLAGKIAYKVKRAVRFPFLDYSTLEKRHAACLAELEVNQAFTPEIYRCVIPITQEVDGRLGLGGGGTPIEWAVKMVRFDEDRTLDRIAQTQDIDDALAHKLAGSVVNMHKRVPAADVENWLAAVDGFLDQNRAAFREMPLLFDASLVQRLDETSRAVLFRLRPLLLARGRAGLVKRGHGDLHLGNIALLDDRPVPFDAIEFDQSVAAGDVFYDLAFLLMDLVERKLGRPANIILNDYLTQTANIRDLDGLAALPFFMSLRAAIRAKVTAARLVHLNDAQARAVTEAAQSYFRLALDMLVPPLPRLIAIGGLSGSGKTSVARELAPLVGPIPGALVIRSDVERKRLFGIAEIEKLPAEAYRAEVNTSVYRLVAAKAARILLAGHSAIVDAVFARKDEREAITAVAQSVNVTFRPIFLVADPQTRIARVGGRRRDASDADTAVVRMQENYDLGQLDWTTIDASGSLAETVARVRPAIE